jgi:hypothetical protein
MHRWYDAGGVKKTRITGNGDIITLGTVTAGNATLSGSVNSLFWQNTNVGAGLGWTTANGKQCLYPTNGSGAGSSEHNIGSPSSSKFKDAYFSGTVNANEFLGDGSKLTGIETGLPDGDYEHSWNIKAKDFISTSDERLKTRIAPMPVGLIDDIKPVSWDWIDGGGKSAGVVAQQLQDIGLGDYVHENEEGQLGVNYQALTAILLAEVINLKAEVGALKS